MYNIRAFRCFASVTLFAFYYEIVSFRKTCASAFNIHLVCIWSLRLEFKFICLPTSALTNVRSVQCINPFKCSGYQAMIVLYYMMHTKPSRPKKFLFPCTHTNTQYTVQSTHYSYFHEARWQYLVATCYIVHNAYPYT